MHYKNITEVQSGDIIVYNGETTKVAKVDTKICKNKVHINEKDCYESFTDVIVRNA